tara:strand:- start:56 stop:466 length:411 start_codon:yes stop_codon:yes gene_type:complete
MKTNKEIEQAKQLLKNNGFYIENLWHIDDVKYGANSEDKYIEYTNDEAYKVLSEAIQQESINERIYDNVRAINETKFRTMKTDKLIARIDEEIKASKNRLDCNTQWDRTEAIAFEKGFINAMASIKFDIKYEHHLD